MQAPLYNRNNAFAQDERNNVGGRSTVRTDQIDDELDDVALSINALCKNLSLLQRDDGRLRDQAVEIWNLSPSARAAIQTKFNPRGLWTIFAIYAVGDLVDVSGSAYVCAIAHVAINFATDYALGRWQVFVPATGASASAFSPTLTILSTNVQAAVVEVDAKLRAMASPQLASFYGGL